MRTAIFVGGPFDGKGMLLAEGKHPYILLPFRPDVPVVFDIAGRGTSPEPFVFQVVRYEWTPVSGLPKSKVDIFTFRGVDR